MRAVGSLLVAAIVVLGACGETIVDSYPPEGTGGGGGSGGVGGIGGGTGGVGGTAGAGGEALDAGLYVMECTAPGLPIPIPFEFILHASLHPALTVGSHSTLTTSAEVWFGRDLPRSPEDESIVSAATLILTVGGAEPTEIVHALANETPYGFLEMDTQVTEATHNGTAETVTVEISQFSVTVTGLPENLVPGGEITVPNEDYECGDIVLRDGSSAFVFPVYP